MNTHTVKTAPVRAVIVETSGISRIEDLIPSNSGSLLAALQGAVGGLIDVVSLDDGLDMYVHDEGFFVCEPNPAVTLIAAAAGRTAQPFFGPAVFTGGVDATGETVSITDEQAAKVQILAGIIARHDQTMAVITKDALRSVGR